MDILSYGQHLHLTTPGKREKKTTSDSADSVFFFCVVGLCYLLFFILVNQRRGDKLRRNLFNAGGTLASLLTSASWESQAAAGGEARRSVIHTEDNTRASSFISQWVHVHKPTDIALLPWYKNNNRSLAQRLEANVNSGLAGVFRGPCY